MWPLPSLAKYDQRGHVQYNLRNKPASPRFVIFCGHHAVERVYPAHSGVRIQRAACRSGLSLGGLNGRPRQAWYLTKNRRDI